MNDNVNYYQLLGVNKNATDDEIKKAYRILIKKWHPDVNKDANATDIFKRITEAKDILLDPIKRSDYNYSLENKVNNKYSKVNNKNGYKNSSNNHNSSIKEEKMYTKWEYFKIYLKYYQISKFRKFIGIILVLLETLLCKLLQFINYSFVFILYYLGDFILYFGIGLVVLYIVLLSSNYLSSYINIVSNNYIVNVLIIILGISLVIFPPFILKFCSIKMPMYLFNLDINLFKKSIGYGNLK